MTRVTDSKIKNQDTEDRQAVPIFRDDKLSMCFTLMKVKVRKYVTMKV